MKKIRPSNQAKQIRVFAWASFLNDFGSDIVYPIWPMFVTSLPGVNMAILGLIDGLGEAIVSISQAFSGYLSDRIRKRKVFVWIGYLFGSLSRVGYAASAGWRSLVPFRILDRTGKIRSAPRDAIVADLSTEKNRGRNFGLLRTMDNLGAVLGILFCILLVNRLGYRNLLLLAAIPSLAGAALIFTRIREHKPERAIYKGLSFKDLSGNFRLFMILSSIFALGSFSYSFLLLYAKEYRFQTEFLPVLYLVFTLTAALFSLPFGRLSDRIGRKPVLALSFVFWALVCISFLFFKHPAAAGFSFVLYGMHKGALEPVQKTWVAELSPPDHRASSLGGFQMLIGLCAFPASFLAGLLWDHLNRTAPFILSLSLTLMAILLLIFMREDKSSY